MISEKSPVIIFGDSITSLGVIRGLKDLATEIYIVSETGSGVGTCSRYVTGVYVLDTHEEKYVEKIVEWIKSSFDIKPTLMVAGNDDALVLLSKECESLCEVAKPTFPSWSVVSLVINKELLNEVAKSNGIPVINTERVGSYAELTEVLNNDQVISFPLFLKSSYSRKFNQKFGTKGVVCHSKQEVLDAYDLYDGFMGALLLQEFLPGDIDQISAVLLVLNMDSKVVAVAANDKIRSAFLYGSTTLSSSMWNQQMVEHAVKLAESIGYVGIVGVQFKYDERDKTYKFLEINGRFSVSISLAQRCGINMPEFVYNEYNGKRSKALDRLSQNYLDDILLWWPLSDISLLGQKRFYMNPWKYIGALIGNGYIIEPFSLKDPKPALSLIYIAVVKLLKKLR